MKKLQKLVQIIMGLIFLIFGVNGFLHFIPMPPMTGTAASFIEILLISKLLYLIKSIEILCSISLLLNRYVSFSLLLLAPIIFNIFWFHIFLEPEGAPLGIFLITMEIFLLWRNKKSYHPLFKSK